jgi:putative ABC transport system permease protein
MLMRDLAWLSLVQLNQNLRRSILVIIGFMVGVAALIAMDTLGRTTSFFLTSFMENLGQANIVRVRVLGLKGGGGTGRSLSMDDVQALRHQLPKPGRVSAAVTDYTSRISHLNLEMVGQLHSVETPFFGIQGLNLSQGRWFVPEDFAFAGNVAIIGNEIAGRLFNGQTAAGAVCLADGVPFKVVGVLAPSIFEDFNRSLFIPLSTGLRRVYDCRRLDTAFIKTDNLEDVEAVAKWTDKFMRQRMAGLGANYEVRVNREALNRIRDSILVLKVFVLMVSGMTLFLGGTGIMNVFLASIAERRTEIGLRKAVGATDGAIALQILTEVGLVCLISSGLGLALGMCIVRGVVWYTGRPELGQVSILNTLGFVIFAVLIGIGFSLSPALKAARKDVVEAIKGI